MRPGHSRDDRQDRGRVDQGRRAAGHADAKGGRRQSLVLLRRVAIAGRSMEPGLRQGDWIVVAALGRRPRVGEIVLARDPRARERFVIKRVAAVSERACTLLGDHPEESTDSRQFGPVRLRTSWGGPSSATPRAGASAASRAVGKMATWGSSGARAAVSSVRERAR